MGRASQERKLVNHGFSATGDTQASIVSTIPDQNDASGGPITPLNIVADFDAESGNSIRYTAAGLPPGLTIEPPLPGIISGTPTTPGTYQSTVWAVTEFGFSPPNSFIWTIT